MPETFAYPEDAELWTPMTPTGPFGQMFTQRGAFWLTVIGRLKPGVTRAAAQSEMDGIAARLERQYPVNAGIGVRLVPLHDEIVGDVRRPLLVLLGAVCFVLLIACANVANLLLTRSSSRQRELAIRSALGAGRTRLLRQMLTESVVLAVIGGTRWRAAGRVERRPAAVTRAARTAAAFQHPDRHASAVVCARQPRSSPAFSSALPLPFTRQVTTAADV